MANKRPGMVVDTRTLCYDKRFWKSVEALKNPDIQKNLLLKLIKFQNAPELSGFNLEELSDCEEGKIYSMRINDSYRIIMQKRDDLHGYFLLAIDKHDDSYDYANKVVVKINGEVQTLQMYDVPDERPAAESGLFPPEMYSDKTLKGLGVPDDERMIGLVRSFKDEDDLMNQIECFPADAQERLVRLATGASLSEVLDSVRKSKEEAPDEDPRHNPETLRSFAFVSNSTELERILTEGSLEEWRVFLHPLQRKLVQAQFDGSALVEGGAGTGKTITAVHRAKELARRMIEGKTEGKILYTFYTANLIEDNVDKLRSICTAEEFKRIDVQNIDKLPLRMLRAAGRELSLKLLGKSELNPVWKEAVDRAALKDPFAVSFYWREWDLIVTEMEEITLEAYLQVRRTGRGKPLTQVQRRETWKVFEAYQEIMANKKWIDNKMAIYNCRKLVEESQKLEYRCIIVDEAQDFSANALRLVRALAGEAHPNDIFLVGDTRQRIYDRKPSLPGCGIDVNRRRSRLYLNYRTTAQLQKAATHLLEGESFEDLTGELDGKLRYFSCTSGLEPQVKHFSSADEEFQWIADNIQGLIAGGVSPSDICLTAYKNDMADEYLKRMREKGWRPLRLGLANVDDRNQEGVRVATMHRVKGLEFQYMFIAGMNAGIFPRKRVSRESFKEDKCLMYVALTRAQRGAYVSGYGQTPSPFLKELMDR